VVRDLRDNLGDPATDVRVGGHAVHLGEAAVDPDEAQLAIEEGDVHGHQLGERPELRGPLAGLGFRPG
jgi:hypothetical protein